MGGGCIDGEFDPRCNLSSIELDAPHRCSISSADEDVTSHVIQHWSVDITSQGHLAVMLNCAANSRTRFESLSARRDVKRLFDGPADGHVTVRGHGLVDVASRAVGATHDA